MPEAEPDALKDLQPTEPVPEQPPVPVVVAPPAEPKLSLTVPPDALPLRDVRVTVGSGGVNVRNEPRIDAPRLGGLPADTVIEARWALLRDQLWLLVIWTDPSNELRDGWIAGEFTNFTRSSAYSQIAIAWYESAPVLAYRRTLVRDLLRVRGIGQDQIRRVQGLEPAALTKFEDVLTRQTLPRYFAAFWQMRERLRLPDPFIHLPLHIMPPAGISQMVFQGFGPTETAFEQWAVYFSETRGLHPGLDYVAPEGSPLIAVADGVIVDFPHKPDPNEQLLALRPFLPERYNRPDGSRVLSNIVVIYGHLTGKPTSNLVRTGDEVRAGQIIGTSGWPVYTNENGVIQIQHNNAHLHLETHFVTDGIRQFGSQQPVNPLLFFTPRIVAFQARLAEHSAGLPYPVSGQPYGRLGFFSLGLFRKEPRSIVWEHTPTREQIWPEGVIGLEHMPDDLSGYNPRG